jgi:hypothetical protein
MNMIYYYNIFIFKYLSIKFIDILTWWFKSVVILIQLKQMQWFLYQLKADNCSLKWIVKILNLVYIYHFYDKFENECKDMDHNTSLYMLSTYFNI